MDAEQIRRLKPMLTRHLKQFDDCFTQRQTRAHFWFFGEFRGGQRVIEGPYGFLFSVRPRSRSWIREEEPVLPKSQTVLSPGDSGGTSFFGLCGGAVVGPWREDLRTGRRGRGRSPAELAGVPLPLQVGRRSDAKSPARDGEPGPRGPQFGRRDRRKRAT